MSAADTLRHAPYAGRRRPFTIGMAPLDRADWFQIDAGRDAELAEKATILASAPDAFLAESGTNDAQAEAAASIRSWFAEFDTALPEPGDEPPLKAVSRHVAEDLVLMQHDGAVWRLVAASLCFPSSWSLSDKFGRPLDGLHHTVPHWGDGMGQRVARIFDNLAPNALVWRLNWSLQQGPAYRMPKDEDDTRPAWTGTDGAYVRVERQTFAKLPQTGAILFTIKIQLDPFEAFAAHPDGARLASALADELEALSSDEALYKGVSAVRPSLLLRLRGLQSSTATESSRPEK